MTLPTPGIPWTHLGLLRLSGFGFGMIGFLLAMDTVVLPVLLLGVAPEALKNTYLGVLGIGGLIIAALVQPVVGRLSDRTRSPLGRRVPYLLWGCLMVCAGLVGIGLAPSYGVLLLVWLFIQANLNIGYGPYQALIRDLVPVGRIGVASSIKILSEVIGSTLLIIAAGFLIQRTGGPDFISWKWTTLGLMMLVLTSSTVVTSVIVRAREAASELTQQVSGLAIETVKGLHPHLKWFLVSRLLMITAIYAFPTYGLFFLRDYIGLENPAESLSTMIPAVGVALAVGAYATGWVSDQVGRKPVILIGAVGACLSTLWMLTADSTGEVVIIATVMGASIGTLMSSSWALANDLGTSGKEGLHMGIVNLATTGGAAASKLMGPGIDLVNRVSPSEGDGFRALLIAASALFLIGALMLIPLKVQPSEAQSGGRQRDADSPPNEGQQEYSSQ